MFSTIARKYFGKLNKPIKRGGQLYGKIVDARLVNETLRSETETFDYKSETRLQSEISNISTRL